MSQQTYPVACDCGQVHWTPAGYAGSKFACGCGKVVEVPALSEMRKAVCRTSNSTRRTAISHTFDPELEIGSRLRRGALPVEVVCVMCREPTTNAVPVSVLCEQEQDNTLGCWWMVLLIPPLTPIGMIVLLVRSQHRMGRNVAFHLPVRMCEDCQPAVFTEDGAKAALRATPLYARLLQQYPAAVVSSAGNTTVAPGSGAMYRQSERKRLSRTLGMVAGVIMFLFLMIQGYWLVDSVGTTGIAGNRVRLAEWDGWCRFGVFIIAAAVGVLVGIGIGRVAAGIHRHFWPDPKTE